MNYVIIVFLLFPAYYLFSFAGYTWKSNKLSSIGSIVLAVLSVVFPAVALFTR